MDRISEERRSYNMSRIRSSDTSIEMRLRRAVWARGLRGYRVHPKGVPGKPDLSFQRWRIAVFVDGCFWHACDRCFVPPSSNTAYWQSKIAKNVERDARVRRSLEEAGWHVVRIWEHEIEEDVAAAAAAVELALRRAGWEPT